MQDVKKKGDMFVSKQHLCKVCDHQARCDRVKTDKDVKVHVVGCKNFRSIQVCLFE